MASYVRQEELSSEHSLLEVQATAGSAAYGSGRRFALLGASPTLHEMVQSVVAAVGAELTSDAIAPGLRAIFVGPEYCQASVPRVDGALVIAVALEEEPRNSRLWSLGRAIGADHIAPLPSAAGWLVEMLSRASSPRGQGKMVTIRGACGGSGSSTLTVLLACSLASTLRILVIDADPLGFGLASVFTGNILDAQPSLPGDDIPESFDTLDPERFAEALPRYEGCWFLGFAARGWENFPSRTVIDAALRTFEVVVVDAGRHRGTKDPFIERADRVLCVVPATLGGMASKGFVDLPEKTSRLVARGPFPEGLDGTAMSRRLQLPLLGELPAMRSLGHGGKPMTAFVKKRGVKKLARALCREVAQCNRMTSGV